MNDMASDQQPHNEGAPSDARRAEGTEQGAASAPPQTTAGTRRLTRRTDRNVLGGVAGGLAAYFDIDPVIVRLAFVAFGFATGPLAVILYLIAWVIVPADRERGTEPRNSDGVPSWVWVTLAVLIGAVFLLPLLGMLVFVGFPFPGDFPGSQVFDFDGPFALWRPGVFWALLLIGLGVLLFRRSEPGTASGMHGGSGTALPASTGTPPVAPRRPPRARSALGRLTVAAALLVAGVTALLDNLGVFDLTIRRLLALLLVVVGAALLVGAWRGRGRWLILVGALLVPVLFATTAAATWQLSFRNGFGDRSVRPSSRAGVAEPFELGAGELTIDLTRVPLSTDPTEVRARVGAGEIRVLVPEDADVTAAVRVGTGAVDILGEQREGPSIELNTAAASEGTGQLVLDLEVGFGEITVERATTSAIRRPQLWRPEPRPFVPERF